MHVVILTRADPALPLARLRAHGELVEIRARELAFGVDEAIEFLNSSMQLGLMEDEIETLMGRTEGRIAGLQLAAISLQGHIVRCQSGSGRGCSHPAHSGSAASACRSWPC